MQMTSVRATIKCINKTRRGPTYQKSENKRKGDDVRKQLSCSQAKVSRNCILRHKSISPQINLQEIGTLDPAAH